MTLPDGFQVELAADVIALADGSVLVGGSPLVSLRLSAQARMLLRDGQVVVDNSAAAMLTERLLATNVAHPRLAGEPRADPGDLTVVIPVRDRQDELGRALAALHGLACVVVDDESADGAAIAALAHRFGARYLRMKSNVGPAAARNAGLSTVSTRYVAFVDSDVEVGAAELTALCRHFADPSVALVAPMVVGAVIGTRRRWFAGYDEIASSLTLGEKPASVRPGATVAWVPSACLVGRTAALGEGFDPSLRVGEDVDLVWRLVASGRRVRYEPAVTARHRIRPTTRTWLARKFFYGSGTAELAARYGDATAPAALSPSYALTAAALLAGDPWGIPLTARVLYEATRHVRKAIAVDDQTGRDRAATRVAARIATRGLWWALRQEAALLLRHWWPATLLAALFSRRVRRAVLLAMAVDTVAFLGTTPAARTRALPQLLLARRLDDLAYGAGLWWGSLRSKSTRALRPRMIIDRTASQRLFFGRRASRMAEPTSSGSLGREHETSCQDGRWRADQYRNIRREHRVGEPAQTGRGS